MLLEQGQLLFQEKYMEQKYQLALTVWKIDKQVYLHYFV